MTLPYAEMSREELLEILRALLADPRRQAPSSEFERVIQELQAHQIELEMQNRELREAQRLIEESRSRYADLYDLAPVVYVTLDRDGRILEANQTAAALFRMGRKYLIGSQLAALVAPASLPAWHAHLRKCFMEQASVTTEVTFLVPGVRTVVAQMMSSPVLGADGAVTGCKTTLTDISALKRSEEKLRLLAQVSAVLASSFDYAATLAETMRLMVPIFADICFVDVLEQSGELRRVGVAFADPGKQQLVDAVRRLAPSATGGSPQALVLRSGEPILVAESSPAGLRRAIAEGAEHEALIQACSARSLISCR